MAATGRISGSLIVSALIIVLPLPSEAGSWREDTPRIEREYGVEIDFDDIAVSPSLLGARSLEVVAAPEAAREAYLVALQGELAVYAKPFLKRNLSKIAIYETMTIDGVGYGGTFDAERRIVYLQGQAIGRTNSGFHHEFSSILIRNSDLLFPLVAWRNANPPGFRYLVDDDASGQAALARNSDTEGDPETYEQGFIAGYGMTRLEEDINTLQQVMLADPERLSFLGGVYPVIGRKATLLAGFLKSIGCGCVPGYWR